MREVLANTTPLIALANIDRLGLLNKLYGTIIVPQAVMDEITREQKADLVIMDDDAAKKTAKFLGLNVTGTLGVLLKAKREGYLEKLEPVMDELIRDGFFISETVKRYVLKEAGE